MSPDEFAAYMEATPVLVLGIDPGAGESRAAVITFSLESRKDDLWLQTERALERLWDDYRLHPTRVDFAIPVIKPISSRQAPGEEAQARRLQLLGPRRGRW